MRRSCCAHHGQFASSLLVLFMVAAMLSTVPIWAASYSLPDGDVVLTISGNIEKYNQDNVLLLDMQLIEQLPVTEFVTRTPWTEQADKWAGVRLNDLFAEIGANSYSFNALALDDYSVFFEGVDLDKYPVILAYKKNDTYLTLRDLGPLWIMFPFDDYPELDSQTNRSFGVWQLIKIEVL